MMTRATRIQRMGPHRALLAEILSDDPRLSVLSVIPVEGLKPQPERASKVLTESEWASYVAGLWLFPDVEIA